MADYWIAREGKKQGPFPEDQVRKNYASGQVLPTDLVWTNGMTGWKAASQVFGAAPPPRAAPAPAAATGAATPYQPPAAAVRDEGDAGVEHPYAGFWARFGALLVDNLLLYVVAFAAAAALGTGFAASGRSALAGIGVNAVFFVGGFLYFTLMESGERGATLGKRLFRMRVVTADGHERISYLRAVGRYFSHALSNLTIYIGYLIQPFTERRQALHDMVSGTVVVALAPASRILIALAVVFGLMAPIGIIAAVALPAYQDYTVRAKVSEALLTASAARAAVQAYVRQHNAFPRTLDEAGVQVQPTRTVQSIAIDPGNGTLTITLAFSPLAGNTILLVPQRAGANNTITWICRPGTAPSRRLPPSCRNG